MPSPILQLHPSATEFPRHPFYSCIPLHNKLLHALGFSFIMRLFLIVSTALFFHLSIQASSPTTDTISIGQALAFNDKLVSKNDRYALGFFETRSKSSEDTTNWYLGIWFNTVPKFTPAWVANRDKPIKNITSSEITISSDGSLVVLNRATKSIFWSTHAKNTTDNTTAMLLSSGNLVLINSSNSSEVLWQSFDYPTDTFFPGAKIGWDKVTGLNRRLVSWKNSIDPATGAYRYELDPSGVNQLLFVAFNSSVPYWSTGVWNGKYFGSIPEMAARHSISPAFVDNDKEKYLTYNLVSENMAENMVTRHAMDISGQAKTYIWMKGSQDWVMINAQPKSQCDVDAICGPFTICNDDKAPQCNCMEGFSIKSPGDWELADRRDGCSRNTQVDCITNTSTTHTTDKFYSVPCVRLPRSARKVEAATSASKCAQVCLNNCSCTSYSFGNSGCSVWHNELHNVKKLQCRDSSTSDGGTLYLRISAKDVESLNNNRRGIVIGVVAGTCISALGLFALILLLMIWKSKKNSGRILNGSQGCNGIIAFRYNDLQRATKNFTNKLGRGSFGSVFKGIIKNSNAIAVKRLDGAYQGEKQFRAEVSSIGAVQHINLVKLVGFCCEGSKRLLVYEYMSNHSLDVHLFRSNSTMLSWTARYQIALGIARGLAYLHDSCRDSIIHCDIKPENILLDASFLPKIADFGMAKILGRDFSRVLTTMRGTVGYLAPEWITGVAITPKVDVYGYGMVLLEIISGRRNTYTTCSTNGNLDVYFPVYAARKLLEGDVGSVVDQMLDGDVNLDEAELVCKVACWCIQDDEFDRPAMGEVVQILERLVDIGMPPIPRRLQSLAGCLHSTGSSDSQRAS